MAPAPPKPDGLGVLKSLQKIGGTILKIRNALGQKDLKVARAEVNDLSRELKKSTKEAKKVQKEMISIIKSLQKGWIEKKR